ncbi:hypothetical protein J4440_05805 [Candidatus Woesearchaeota archaeon]|nr:hypothetical protein [Candidatus Woesearchaeota archaeon]
MTEDYVFGSYKKDKIVAYSMGILSALNLIDLRYADTDPFVTLFLANTQFVAISLGALFYDKTENKRRLSNNRIISNEGLESRVED